VAVVPVRLGERALGVLSVRDGRAEASRRRTSSCSRRSPARRHRHRERPLFREKERLAVQELLRLRKLSMLSEIGSAMQGMMQMEALLRSCSPA